MTAPILVLGLGNELFSDEGLGVEAARRVSALELANAEVVDGGTLGLELVPTLADREYLVVLDAVVADGAEPGTILVLDDSTVRSARQLLVSAHQLGLSEALAAVDLWGRGPAVCAGIGMVPASLDTGYGLSPAIVARIDALTKRAAGMVEEWNRIHA